VNFFLHWLAVHSGTDAPGDHWYNFWSGFGSDLGEVTLLSLIVAGFRHVNCHTKGCPRIGRYEVVVNGQKYKVCRTCHQRAGHDELTTEHLDAHKERNAA
jgi:hypothetical protein